MELKINRDIRGDVSSPTLLAGWAGMGSVGVGAIDYLRRHLDAAPFAELDLSEFFTPEAVVVENGIAKSFTDLPSHIFYYVREPELIIFESEAQVGGTGGITLMTQILDFASELKVRKIYTGAAFARPISHREPVKVLGVANRESLRDGLVHHGVEILDEGHISGLNGLLLGFAGLRDIEAACLLATMPQYAQMMPNPKASREIIRVFESILGIQIDMEEINQAAEQMDRTMFEIEEKIRTTFSSMEMEEDEASELEEVDEEQVPQYVMEKIEKLYEEIQQENSRGKAAQLKKELDRWNLYSLYEDRFLNLFRRDKEGGV